MEQNCTVKRRQNIDSCGAITHQTEGWIIQVSQSLYFTHALVQSEGAL